MKAAGGDGEDAEKVMITTLMHANDCDYDTEVDDYGCENTFEEIVHVLEGVVVSAVTQAFPKFKFTLRNVFVGHRCGTFPEFSCIQIIPLCSPKAHEKQCTSIWFRSRFIES